MPESLFDPTIHQSAAPLAGYKFEHEALVARLDELKKVPTEEMKSFLQAHPEYKSFNCAALAEYAGLSEPTLKKLKSGQIADPRGSTFWILFSKFDIRPRDVLKCIPPGICNLECANQARIKLEEVQKQMAVDQEELVYLRKRVLAESTRATAAEEKLLASDEKSSRRDDGIRTRNIIIFILAALLLASLVIGIYLLWEATHPYSGRFRV